MEYLNIEKKATKKRDSDEIVESAHIELKKSKENTKEEEKVALQSNLAGFFGLSTTPQAKFQGSAQHQEFQSDEVSIWHWNINGLNAILERGDF